MDDLTNATNKVGQGLEAAEKEAVRLQRQVTQTYTYTCSALHTQSGEQFRLGLSGILRDSSCVSFLPQARAEAAKDGNIAAGFAKIGALFPLFPQWTN